MHNLAVSALTIPLTAPPGEAPARVGAGLDGSCRVLRGAPFVHRLGRTTPEQEVLEEPTAEDAALLLSGDAGARRVARP